MSSIDEKRVHGPNTDAAALFVAGDIGLVRVSAAGERVGTMEVVHRCTARDLAASDGRVAVATDEDVLVVADGTPAATGFGPATAVGFAETLLAATPDGTVARRTEAGWDDVGSVGTVRAIGGSVLGTAGGVYRLADGLQYAGLDDVHDVAVAPPRAATAAGLYRLGNGWLDERDGEFSMVAADAASDRAHAATDERFYEHGAAGWRAIEGIDGPVVGVAYAGGVYAVAADGTLLVETDDGWREHPVGMGETHAIVSGPTDRKPV